MKFDTIFPKHISIYMLYYLFLKLNTRAHFIQRLHVMNLYIYTVWYMYYTCMFTLISNFIYLKSLKKQHNEAAEFLIC